MARNIEYGIFLPVGSGGWIPSTNAPVLDGSYSYNRQVAISAEQYGFHFALSQAVWRATVVRPGTSTTTWSRSPPPRASPRPRTTSVCGEPSTPPSSTPPSRRR
ncbi:hypothetical protein [Microbacterium sp. NIBRBAC000506063]|uniref:hypothetical protein n=1 Tax=Microbacterium sp. NIBRBAC000506063 TaxID=2734618 RepID=UPI001CB75C37|nr:hypothetical protein [Microbacterium sp. NIBRBAC000506063]